MAKINNEQYRQLFGGFTPPAGVSYAAWYKQFQAETNSVTGKPLKTSPRDKLKPAAKWALYKLILADTDQVISYSQWQGMLAGLGYDMTVGACQHCVVNAWAWAGLERPERWNGNAWKGGKNGQ